MYLVHVMVFSILKIDPRAEIMLISDYVLQSKRVLYFTDSLLLFLSPQFPLSSVVMCASHQENKRLFGFVLHTAGGRVDGRPVTVCYIFESNNDGEKVQ